MTGAGIAGVAGIWQKLRRRKVVQWGIAYVAAAWALKLGPSTERGRFPATPFDVVIAPEGVRRVPAVVPMDPGRHAGLGDAYLNTGRLDEALGSYRTALRLAPDANGGHGAIGHVLLLKGQYDAAFAEYQTEHFAPPRLSGLACAHHALGQNQASDAALDELIEKHRHWGVLIAMSFAYGGQFDRAFEWLSKAATQRDSSFVDVPATLWLKNLHDDPRRLPFLRKHGMAPEQLAAIKFDVTVPR